MDIPVLVNPKCEHVPRVNQAIEVVKKVQNYFRPTRHDAPWLPHDKKEREEVTGKEVRKLVAKEFGKRPFIAVVQNPLDEEYFSNEFRQAVVITLARWEKKYAPPPISIYLAYLFAGAFLNFASDLSDDMMDRFTHEPPIGCIFDACNDKESIKLGMVGGNICGTCETGLFGMGMTDEQLRAVEQILQYVRGETIRRPRRLGSHIFIGHGHSKAWHEVADYLMKEHHLEIEEFNREPTAGVSTLDRLKQMLERSCFAILVMTGEDLHDDRELHARENVVHEIGLFQGRLGFPKAIILKEKDVPEFSNIHGLTYVSFPKGKPQNAFPEISRTLRREGLIQ